MSEQLPDVVVSVLGPLVGRAMATVYVEEAAQSLGKAGHELGPGDVTAVCDMLRSKISPLAARPVVDQAIADILVRTYVRQGSG